MWSWHTAAEAIALSGRAVGTHPGAARLWSVHGMAQARVVTEFGPWSDSVARARDAFSRAVELEPHQPWTWLEWARLERNLGHTEEAIGLVQRALEEEPNTIRARLLLARLHLDRDDQEAAREAYGAALQSARLRTRSGLNTYERELLTAPAWQFREIAEALQ
jgi:tetratricopeptide (TPR) repeat protein